MKGGTQVTLSRFRSRNLIGYDQWRSSTTVATEDNRTALLLCRYWQ
uniref:Uncharacterized protein n=1 Tax=Anguilla anguilla TaxID=7936 RepID=A0A0E9W6H6_ANGAN